MLTHCGKRGDPQDVRCKVMPLAAATRLIDITFGDDTEGGHMLTERV